ncbi:hypothetical protein LTR50_003271 [Elasticomyces elasticus]|nr:hypothetical protein LTR50_003271 [Elasticomyces elasticus]
MPRLVRRAPVLERIKAYLNPWDFLLWLSEELSDETWDETLKDWAIPISLACNFVFLIARANSTGSLNKSDDVFAEYDGRKGSGWLVWFASFLVHTLTLLSVTNAIYTFARRRHYRLFESSIDVPPSTPSAHRVRVDSSPLASSPLRFLSSIIQAGSAAARAHPDATRDVWELAVWDPKPVCLRLFCLFSPGHVLVYLLFLPYTPLDPKPSVTVVTTILLGVLLSVQLSFMQRSFSQQTKDTALIHKEVLHEYDTKFVHPSLNKPVRDVGIQTPPSSRTTPERARGREVDVYTPTTIVNRGFRTNPNPNYAAQYDPDGLAASPQMYVSKSTGTPALKTPNAVMNGSNGYTAPQSAYVSSHADFSSPLKPHHQRERSPMKGEGGSLGVYTHAASPLRRATSTNILRAGGQEGRRERHAASPLKRTSTPGGEGFERRFGGLRESRRDTGRW